MFKQLPVKKEYLLIAATIILLLLSYRLAFKNTLEAWQTHKQLKAKLSRSEDLSYQPGFLERKNNNLNKVIDLYKADTASFRSNIINIISTIAEKENAKLINVPEQDISYHTDHFIIEKLDFEGDYFALLKIGSDLQLANGIGIIRGESWNAEGMKFDSDTDKKLVLEVYLEIFRAK